MIKEGFKNLENVLKRWRHVIAFLILVMLIVLSMLTIKFFDKQNEIIETGGFTDGKIKCACTQEAWEQFEELKNLNISEILVDG